MVVNYVIREELAKVSTDKMFTEKVFNEMGIVFEGGSIWRTIIPRNMIIALLHGWLYIGKVMHDNSGKPFLSVAKCRMYYNTHWHTINSWKYPGECLKFPEKRPPKGELEDCQAIIELLTFHKGIRHIKTYAYGAFSIKFIPICHEIVQAFLVYLTENSKGDSWEPRFEKEKIIKYFMAYASGESFRDSEEEAKKDLPKDNDGNIHPIIDPEGIIVERERVVLQYQGIIRT